MINHKTGKLYYRFSWLLPCLWLACSTELSAEIERLKESPELNEAATLTEAFTSEANDPLANPDVAAWISKDPIAAAPVPEGASSTGTKPVMGDQALPGATPLIESSAPLGPTKDLLALTELGAGSGARSLRDQEVGAISGHAYQYNDLTFGARQEIVYSDNLLATANNPIESLSSRTTAFLGFLRGDTVRKIENYFSATYEPGVTWYDEPVLGDDFNFDQSLALAGRVGLSAFLVDTKVALRQNEEISQEAGTRAERIGIDGELSVGYRLTPKLAVAATAVYRDVSFGDVALVGRSRELIDQQTYGWGSTVTYEHSPSVHYWARGIAGVSEVGTSPDRDYYEVLVGLRKQLSKSFSLDASAGIDHRSGGEIDETTEPIASAELIYRSDIGDTIIFGILKEFGASTFIKDANVNTTTIRLKGSKNFANQISASLEGTYSLFSYEGGERPLNDENFFSISPAVDYRFTDRLTGGVYYLYGSKDTGGPELLDYTEQRVGVNASLNF